MRAHIVSRGLEEALEKAEEKIAAILDGLARDHGAVTAFIDVQEPGQGQHAVTIDWVKR